MFRTILEADLETRMAIETRVFDLSEVLNSEERIAAYLEEIFADQEIKKQKNRAEKMEILLNQDGQFEK